MEFLFQGLSQETLWLLVVFYDLLLVVILYKFFGKYGLYTAVILGIILGNLQGGKVSEFIIFDTTFTVSMGAILYSGIYFYDKELMTEHLSGPSKSIDFGHGSYNQKWIIPEMQELGLLERASAGLAFKDVPKGFLHRNVIPVDTKLKIIKDYCLIEHLSNKFANENSDFGKIKVEDIFN